MEFIMILFFMAVYIVLAVLFVFLIRKLTKLKFLMWLAIVFVILLPTWDVVFGIAVYHIGCRYIPKMSIYETAETDGMYYEGLHDYVYKLERDSRRKESDEELTQIGGIYHVFPRGYTFAEAQVTKKNVNYTEKKKIEPLIYRCVPLPKDKLRPDFQRTSCSIVNDIKSRYLVKVTTTKLGVAEVDFKNIYNRTNGELMAEYKQVVIWPYFPFFNWLHWGQTGTKSVSCPATDRYYYFEYEVLKPKK